MVKRRTTSTVNIVTKKLKQEAEVKIIIKKEGTVPDIEDLPNVFEKAVGKDIEGINAPKGWIEFYNELVDMRAKMVAPVDHMGCERIPDGITPFLLVNDPKTYRFQLLISLMLSSQTKDEVINDAMRKLHYGLRDKGFEKGLTLESVQTLTDQELDGFIGKVGFHNRKTGYIKKACTILQEKFESDIPTTIEDIVSLPGVGPKMGFLLLQRGWNKNDGIGVDVHLHRLSMMWGWVKKNNNPEITRKLLQEWLPRKFWADINPLLVGFGQVVCTPQTKNCDICTLGIKKLCKSGDKKLINNEINEERMAKLLKNRGDVSQLVTYSNLLRSVKQEHA